MRKSKKIKDLESRVDQLSMMTQTLISLVNDIMDKNNKKSDLDAGKWYKDKP
jgi:hypothetical protein